MRQILRRTARPRLKFYYLFNSRCRLPILPYHQKSLLWRSHCRPTTRRSWGDVATALVDSGYCSNAAQTVALVSSLGGRPLDLLSNTHLHTATIAGGNASALQARGWPCRPGSHLASGIRQDWDRWR